MARGYNWKDPLSDPITDIAMENYNLWQMSYHTGPSVQLMHPRHSSRYVHMSRNIRIIVNGQGVGWIQRVRTLDPPMWLWICDVYGVRGGLHPTLKAAMDAFLLHTQLCHPERMDRYALRA